LDDPKVNLVAWLQRDLSIPVFKEPIFSGQEFIRPWWEVVKNDFTLTVGVTPIGGSRQDDFHPFMVVSGLEVEGSGETGLFGRKGGIQATLETQTEYRESNKPVASEAAHTGNGSPNHFKYDKSSSVREKGDHNPGFIILNIHCEFLLAVALQSGYQL